MKAESLYDFRTLRDIKKDIRYKFKIITVNFNVEDIKKIKKLILQKLVISMAEIIRCAIIHYIFVEDLALSNDSNYGKYKSQSNRKTVVGFHISTELILLIEQKYREKPHGAVIRQMLHAFITKFFVEDG